jgi:hypothetical protein
MSETVAHPIVEPAPDLSQDFTVQLDALRAAGGQLFDPVRMHYMEVLARRAIAQQGKVKSLLEAKLLHAIAAFKERMMQAQKDAKLSIAKVTQSIPSDSSKLERYLATGDLKRLQRSIASLSSSQTQASLGTLLRELEPHFPNAHATGFAVHTKSRPELKTIRNFRNTWSTLSADKQVAHALAHAPKNAGPINSHILVVRSLALMRDISPDYLKHFLSYADTLLCLDQYEKEKLFNIKKTATVKTAKKSS